MHFFEQIKVISTPLLTNIAQMFYGCSSLVEIELTHNVNRIYEEAFSNCKCLKNISDRLFLRSTAEGLLRPTDRLKAHHICHRR